MNRTKLSSTPVFRLAIICLLGLMGCDGAITTAASTAHGGGDGSVHPTPNDSGALSLDGSIGPELDGGIRVEQPPICSIDGLCFAHPSPQAYALNGGFGTGPESAYLVGEQGTVLHYVNDVFVPIASGTDANLLAAHGDSQGRVWVVGEEGLLLEISGETANTLRLPAELNASTQRPHLQAVRSAADDTAWIAGTYDDAPLLLHLSGSNFENHSDDVAAHGPITAFFSFAADDLWATTSTGNILHFDGSEWTPSPTPTNRPLHAIAGRQDGELWAAGDNGVLLRRFEATPPEDPDQDNPAPAWTWERVQSGTDQDYVSILVDSRNAPPPVLLDAGMMTMDLTDAGMAPPDPIVHLVNAGGKRSVFSRDSATVHPHGDAPFRNLIQLDAKQFIGVGEAGYMARVDGDSWAPLSAGTRRNLYALTLRSANGVLAVGDTAIIEQGAKFASFNFGTGRTLSAVDCDGDDCWAVGTQGTIMHHDGTAAAPVLSVHLFGKRLRGIVHVDGTLVVVGDDGLVARQRPDDTDFEILDSDTNRDLHAIWARGPDDLWIAGDDGTLLRLSSGVFTAYPMPESSQAASDLRAITGDHRTVWIAGNVGTILRVDVSGVRSMRSGGHRTFNAIAMLNSGNILAAGSGGHVVVSENISDDGAEWRALESPTDVSLHGIAQTPERIYLGGLDGVVLSTTSL